MHASNIEIVPALINMRWSSTPYRRSYGIADNIHCHPWMGKNAQIPMQIEVPATTSDQFSFMWCSKQRLKCGIRAAEDIRRLRRGARREVKIYIEIP